MRGRRGARAPRAAHLNEPRKAETVQFQFRGGGITLNTFTFSLLVVSVCVALAGSAHASTADTIIPHDDNCAHGTGIMCDYEDCHDSMPACTKGTCEIEYSFHCVDLPIIGNL